MFLSVISVVSIVIVPSLGIYIRPSSVNLAPLDNLIFLKLKILFLFIVLIESLKIEIRYFQNEANYKYSKKRKSRAFILFIFFLTNFLYRVSKLITLANI